jgi:glycosyltransferase involved in cell wall biosynthesis
LIGFENNAQEIIKIYDNHNITILPSFTEAHPKVIDESLARMRPVIIFEEIAHIIQNRYGIFVSKRNAKPLLEVISFILSNYSNILAKMEKNKLPTKKKFISQMIQILN